MISRKHNQICIFRRRPITPGFLSDCYFLDSRPRPFVGRLTPYGEEVQNLHWENPYTFVVEVDCQIEFIVKRSIFEKLQDIFTPIWTADTNINFFSDQPSGYLALLRVYQTKTVLDKRLLEKGRQGSAQIMKLYDLDGNETQVFVDQLTPVLSDARFSYYKDEMLSLLKRENALIAVYENSPDGIDLLQQRIDASKSLRPKKERTYNPSGSVDMAQTDYAIVYSSILEKAPGLKMLVDYVQSVKPAQYGEIDQLTARIKSGDQNARQRLFDTHLRAALKMGLWASEHYRVDLEDAVQEAMIGLWHAIDIYDKKSDKKFAPYALLWMRQNMVRKLPIAEDVCRFPMHFLTDFFPIVDWVRENEYRIGFDDSFYQEAVSKIQQSLNCTHYMAVQYLSLVLSTESFERLLVNEDEGVIDKKWSYAEVEQKNDFLVLKKTLFKAIAQLKERDGEIIKKRYGIDCREMTLEEIGLEFDLTRERVRQIIGKSFRKMRGAKTIIKELEQFLDTPFDI